MMPDSFYVDAAIISTMLTRITGGIHIFLGNSREELENMATQILLVQLSGHQ
jgi:hypothetical protein